VLKKISKAIQRLAKTDQEYFYEQFMYGHREILLAYARSFNPSISPGSILRAGVQHGWAGDANIWRVRNRNLTPAPRYVWENRFEIKLPKTTGNKAIGAPWLYLLNLLDIEKGFEYRLKSSLEKKEFLIFPGHNLWNTSKPISDQASAFHKITKGETATVCLYWIDYLQPEVRRSYENLGFEVECVGYLGSPTSSTQANMGRTGFLLESVRLMLNHKTIITDEFSSGLLYAASLGLKVVFMDDARAIEHDIILSKDREDSFVGFYLTASEWIKNCIPELYLTINNGKQFVDFSYQELGFDVMLAEKELGKFKWIESDLAEQIQLEFESSVKNLRENIIKL
jgi:hypothetical protein